MGSNTTRWAGPELIASRTAIRVIDSHTGGEPTRVVVAGTPDLGSGDMRARRDLLRKRFDWLRTSLVTEPRGAAWMVGAVLQEPVDPDCATGVIFFNNVGYLGMCGHGLIGVVAALSYLKRITIGPLRIETPVGDVLARLDETGAVAFENVPSYRQHKDVAVTLPELGTIIGDVAWGGNWFFLGDLDPAWMSWPLERLTDLAGRVRAALSAEGVTGAEGADVDHIEFSGPPSDAAKADSRSFVLCPGGHYDRSPCGTGLSAKLACLAADGRLAPGESWRQESMIGSVFQARYRAGDQNGVIVPLISGQAFVNADLRMVIDPDDPFSLGMPGDAGLEAS
jgi:4-hydroxyproline epimerase